MADAYSLQVLIDAVQREAPTDNPLDQLATASTTAARITETGDALLDHYVGRCRETGNSWAEISGVLGVTKQAVHKRFGAGGPPGLQRWVPRARAALDKAAAIARDHDNSYVGTEHLLLGLLSVPTSVAARVLNAAGLTYDTARTRVFDEPIPTAPITDQELPDAGGLSAFVDTIAELRTDPPLTPRAKVALAMGLSEALRLGHNYIGTEHLLLGLYHQPNNLVTRILTDAGLDLETARERVIAEIISITERGRR